MDAQESRTRAQVEANGEELELLRGVSLPTPEPPWAASQETIVAGQLNAIWRAVAAEGLRVEEVSFGGDSPLTMKIGQQRNA